MPFLHTLRGQYTLTRRYAPSLSPARMNRLVPKLSLTIIYLLLAPPGLPPPLTIAAAVPSCSTRIASCAIRGSMLRSRNCPFSPRLPSSIQSSNRRRSCRRLIALGSGVLLIRGKAWLSSSRTHSRVSLLHILHDDLQHACVLGCGGDAGFPGLAAWGTVDLPGCFTRRLVWHYREHHDD